MALSNKVFIKSKLSAIDFAKEMKNVLNLPFEEFSDEDETWWEFRDERGLLQLGQHDFENDRDMAFEDYDYCIDFYPNRDLSEDIQDKLRETVSKSIFDGLKKHNSYALMRVYDVQRKLDEFNPEIS